MKALLDTCVFFWLLVEPDKLSRPAREICENDSSELFLIVASIWEMQIKIQRGKMTLGVDLATAVQNAKSNNNLTILSIEERHIYELKNLPLIHSDPFDRILIVQARDASCALVTSDQKIKSYPVSVIW